jgi:malate dehydrogenase (quinone)
MVDLLKRCFPDRYEGWLPTLKQLIPTVGSTLNDRPAEAERVLAETAAVLDLAESPAGQVVRA